MTTYSINDIPIGAANAITRPALARLWGVDDRTVRERISIMRQLDYGDNYVIVSHSRCGAKGYYRTDDPEHIRHFINETRKRVRSTVAPIAQAERVLKQLAQQ